MSVISRRIFLKAMVAGALLSPCEGVFASMGNNTERIHERPIKGETSLRKYHSSESADKSAFPDEKRLRMYNVHTHEYLDIQYYASGSCEQEAHEKINYFLRCHYTNEVAEVDIGLLDLLCSIKDSIQHNGVIQVISGYRSSRYNELLIQQGRNVSRNSLHLKGLAIDFAMKEVSNRKLSTIARSFAAGGVGVYPEFVHIDVGRIRFW